MAACSTVDRVPTVTTRTRTELLTPPAALMQACAARPLRRTVLVRDMADNLATLQGDYDACAARLGCLVWWWQSAAKGKVTAECDKPL